MKVETTLFFFFFIKETITCNSLEIHWQEGQFNDATTLLRNPVVKSDCQFGGVPLSFFSDWSTYSLSLQVKLALILVLLNKLKCHAHFQFSANQITWSRFLIQIHILNGKQCRSRSVGFFRIQLIWIYIVCKGRTYLGSAGQGLIYQLYQQFVTIT